MCHGRLVSSVAVATTTAFTPLLDQMHDCRPAAVSLAAKITYPNAMRFFSLGDMLRTLSVLLPLPQELPELQRRILNAISEIDPDMVQQVWAKMDYQLDICCVTKGG